MNPHIGSSLDELLEEDAVLEEVNAVAIKRVVAWQIAQEMKAQQLTKQRWRRRCIPAALHSTACSTKPIPA